MRVDIEAAEYDENGNADVFCILVDGRDTGERFGSRKEAQEHVDQTTRPQTNGRQE